MDGGSVEKPVHKTIQQQKKKKEKKEEKKRENRKKWKKKTGRMKWYTVLRRGNGISHARLRVKTKKTNQKTPTTQDEQHTLTHKNRYKVAVKTSSYDRLVVTAHRFLHSTLSFVIKLIDSGRSWGCKF